MELTTSDYMEQARMLAETKRRVLETVTASAAAAKLSVVQKRRKAATLFYALATESTKLSEATTRQLVGVYERFGESQLRPQLERLFRIGELAALTAKSDEVLQKAIALKQANPAMTRSELMGRLKEDSKS
jgi:hypothetical protein